MLDKKFLIENPQIYEENMRKRNANSDFATFQELHTQHKTLINEIQALRTQQKQIVGFSEEAKTIKEQISTLEITERKLEQKLQKWLYEQPNLLLDEVPSGKTEEENQVIFQTPIPATPKNVQPHYDLIDNLVMKEESSNLSGSRFLVLKKELAKLKRALMNFLIQHNEENGYEFYDVPFIVNEECLYGTGQLPKFREDAFQLTNNQWLISTGEIPLVNLFANKCFAEEDLPKLCTTYSACFRSEAGSASRDTKGMIRLHQFHKVELVSICTEENVEFYHQKQLETAKKALDKLGLAYRVILICSGDTGFTAQKQYDIEVWLPGSDRFVEIASCSQCGTFQARRANIKYKNKDKKNCFAYTLNGSSLPLERLIAAIIENYYDSEKNAFNIPLVLQSFMGTKTIHV